MRKRAQPSSRRVQRSFLSFSGEMGCGAGRRTSVLQSKTSAQAELISAEHDNHQGWSASGAEPQKKDICKKQMSFFWVKTTELESAA